MDCILSSTLLTPVQRTAVVEHLNHRIRTEAAFTRDGFSVLSATAYPHAGVGGHHVNVAVVIDRPTRLHADLLAQDHGMKMERVGKQIALHYFTTREALAAHRFDFGADVLGEQLIADDALIAASRVLMNGANRSIDAGACHEQALCFVVGAQQRLKNESLFYPFWVQQAAVVAAIYAAVAPLPGYRLDAESIARLGVEAAAELHRIETGEPIWRWSSARLQVPPNAIRREGYSLEFRDFRMHALDLVEPATTFDATAAASAVLRTRGGPVPIRATAWSQVVAALPRSASVERPVAEADSDDFIL